MRILLVQLSTLGDVVHALPVVQDIRRGLPDSRIDWLVEPAYAPVVKRSEGIGEVLTVPLRRWRDGWWQRATWQALGRVRRSLADRHYDAVIDLQGLTETAVLARLARLVPGGRRFGLGNATEGSPWEPPAAWLVDRPIRVEPRLHLLDRSRVLVAQALNLPIKGTPRWSLRSRPLAAGPVPMVAFVHGTHSERKLWPQAHWLTLGKRILHLGWGIALPQGNEAEQTRAELIAASLQFERAPLVQVWPTLGLDQIVDRLAGVQGVIGVDSGLSQLAAALGLPLVQIHNEATAWRTGPNPSHGQRHQVAVESIEGRGAPTPDAVWSAWRDVMPPTATR